MIEMASVCVHVWDFKGICLHNGREVRAKARSTSPDAIRRVSSPDTIRRVNGDASQPQVVRSKLRSLSPEP